MMRIIRSGLVIEKSQIFYFDNESFEKMLKKVYEPDSIADWKIEKKLEELEKRERVLCYLEIRIPNPQYRVKSDGLHISVVTEQIKKYIRTKYASLKPFQGKPDILIHMGDTHNHTQFVYDCLTNFCNKNILLADLFKKIEKLEYALVKVDTPYQTKNFPNDYAVGKDIDVLVTSNDVFAIYEEVENFSKNYLGFYDVINIKEDRGFRIRFEKDSALHYQIDVKINDDIKKYIDIKTRSNVLVKELKLEYELIQRIKSFIKKPHKKHHLDFINKNMNNVNLDLLKEHDILDFYNKEIKK